MCVWTVRASQDYCICDQLDPFERELNYKFFEGKGNFQNVRSHVNDQMNKVAAKIKTIISTKVASKLQMLYQAARPDPLMIFQMTRLLYAVENFSVRKLGWVPSIKKNKFNFIPMNEGNDANLKKGQFNYSEAIIYELRFPMASKQSMKNMQFGENSGKWLNLHLMVKIKQSRIPNYSGYLITWTLDQPFVYSHAKKFDKISKSLEDRLKYFTDKPIYDFSHIDETMLRTFVEGGGHSYKFTQGYGNFIPVHLCRNSFIFYSKVFRLLTRSYLTAMISTRDNDCADTNGAMLQLNKVPRSLHTMTPQLFQRRTENMDVLAQETKVRMIMPLVKTFNKNNYVVKKGIKLESPPDDRYFTHLRLYLYHLAIYIRNIDIYQQVGIFFKGSSYPMFYQHLLDSVQRTRRVYQYMAYMMRIFMRYYHIRTPFQNSVLKISQQNWNLYIQQYDWFRILVELCAHFFKIETDEGYFQVVISRQTFSEYLMTLLAQSNSAFTAEVLKISRSLFEIEFNKFKNSVQGKTLKSQNEFMAQFSLESICQKYHVHMLVFVKTINSFVTSRLLFKSVSQRMQALKYFKTVGYDMLPSLTKDFIFSKFFLTSVVDLEVNLDQGRIRRVHQKTHRRDRQLVKDREGVDEDDAPKSMQRRAMEKRIEANTVELDIHSRVAKNLQGNLMIQDAENVFEIVPDGFGTSITRQKQDYLQKIVIESENRNSVKFNRDDSPRRQDEIKEVQHQRRNVEPSAQLLNMDLITVEDNFTKKVVVTQDKTLDADKVLISANVMTDPRRELELDVVVDEKPFSTSQIDLNFDTSESVSTQKRKSSISETGEMIVKSYLQQTQDQDELLFQKIDGLVENDLIQGRKNDTVEDNALKRKKNSNVLQVSDREEVIQTDLARTLENNFEDMDLATKLQVNAEKLKILEKRGEEVFEANEDLKRYFKEATFDFVNLYDETQNDLFKQLIEIIFTTKINRRDQVAVPSPILLFEQDTISQVQQVTNDTIIDEQEMTEFLSFLIMMSTFLDTSSQKGFFSEPNNLILNYNSSSGTYLMAQPEMTDTRDMVGNDKLIVNLKNNILTLRHQLIVAVHDMLVEEQISGNIGDFILRVDKDYRAHLTLNGQPDLALWYIADRIFNIKISQLGNYSLTLVAMSNESRVETDISLESLFAMNALKDDNFTNLAVLTQKAVIDESDIDATVSESIKKSSLNDPSFMQEDSYLAVGKMFESGENVTVTQIKEESAVKEYHSMDDSFKLFDQKIKESEERRVETQQVAQVKEEINTVSHDNVEMEFMFDISQLKKDNPNFDLEAFQNELMRLAEEELKNQLEGNESIEVKGMEFSVNESLTVEAETLVSEITTINRMILQERRLII